MLPVNPEAIGVFGLFATVICFGLEQVGVGVKGADHEKLTRTLGYIAIIFGGVCQLYTSISMFLFSCAGDHSKYLGTVFGFFGLFWILVGLFFLKGGDKKVMAHFFFCALILVLHAEPAVGAALTVVMVYLILLLIWRFFKANAKEQRIAAFCEWRPPYQE
jgi:hypothetical protein